MVSSKQSPEAATKGTYQCSACDIEFTGTVCPDCGNKKGNKKVATDGITQEDHRTIYFPSSRPLLDEFGMPLSDEDLMNLQYTKMAQEEFLDNMRASRLNMSEIKKLESEKKLTIKRAELDRLKEGISDTYPIPHAAPPQPEMPQGPIFGAQSPQSQFLSQLMRMGDDERAVFIEQLSDADPNALALLNAMVTPQSQNPMMGYNNPMGMFPGYYPPAAQHERAPPESPVVLMKEMFSLMKEMQPNTDNSTKDYVRELKDELKSLHNRIDSVMHESAGRDMNHDPVLQHLKHLEDKINQAQQQPSFSDQLRGIKSMVDDIKEMGLINSSSPGTSTADQIELKKIDHQIDMEKKQFHIDEEHLEIERNNQKTKEKLVQQMFTRELVKPEIEDILKQTAQPFGRMIGQTVKTVPIQQPIDIIEEIQTDTGSIREIQRSGKYVPGPE